MEMPRTIFVRGIFVNKIMKKHIENCWFYYRVMTNIFDDQLSM